MFLTNIIHVIYKMTGCCQPATIKFRINSKQFKG